MKRCFSCGDSRQPAKYFWKDKKHKSDNRTRYKCTRQRHIARNYRSNKKEESSSGNTVTVMLMVQHACLIINSTS